jgi:hypothetical protein
MMMFFQTVRREFMTGLFHKFICLLTLSFISISCGSSPNSSQQPVAPQQPVVTELERQERLLKQYTTYQTSLTNEDIMRSFVNEVRTYLQRYDRTGCYYWVEFEVFQDRNKQNNAWETVTGEAKDQWGTSYVIVLAVNNAGLMVIFRNTSFEFDGQDAWRTVTTRSDTKGGNEIRQHIVSTATSMFDESEMVLKMNNRNYSDKSKAMFLAEIMRIMQ